MVELKSDAELALMREAGRVVARALTTVREQATIGVSRNAACARSPEDTNRPLRGRGGRPVGRDQLNSIPGRDRTFRGGVRKFCRRVVVMNRSRPLSSGSTLNLTWRS